MKYFEISPLISERLAVFPGDQKFRRDLSLDFKTGAHLQLSSIQTTLHLGAHADSSGHYHMDGEGIDKRSLHPFFGKAQVIDIELAGSSQNLKERRIYPQDLKVEIRAPRVLLKTNSFPDPNFWQSDFISLSPEVVDFMAARGVSLIGIDTPSVDPETSKALESHQALFKNNISVLEGLVLNAVPAGIYQLVALPLAIADADASPVRAILIESPERFPQSDLIKNI